MLARMGTSVPQDRPATRDDSPEMRHAIVAAARQVAIRDGVVEMSLSTVAREAGVSPASVYDLFSSKNDLLVSVIADDLATLARAMREVHGVHDKREQPDHLPAAAAFDTPNPDNQQAAPMASVTEHPYSGDPSVSAEARDFPRRFPVVQARREQLSAEPANPDGSALDAIARLQEAVAKLEARPVDAWLERRLREFERALAALQDRREERSTGESQIDEKLRDLKASVDALEHRQIAAAEQSARALIQRLEASEAHLRELLSGAEADAGLLAKRITVVENAAFAAMPEHFETTQPSAVEEAEESSEVSAPEPQNETVELPPVTADLRTASYLADARRSAQAAEVAQAEVRKKSPRRTSRSMLYATAGSLFIFVVLIVGTGIVLRNSAMTVQPLSAPVVSARHVARHEARRTLATHAPATSQSRLTKLAESGDPTAELLIGLDYLNGSGVVKNDSAAFQWLSRAASKGQALAEYELGTLYQEGRGVHADPVQAFQWYGSSALRGNRRAMHSLAIAYAEGIGTSKNLPEAARWFERAATLGAVNSQFNLAVLYERGMGVPQSLSNAYKWYAIAAAQGDKESQARTTALASALSPTDLADAKSAAEAYKPNPVDPVANFTPKLPPQS